MALAASTSELTALCARLEAYARRLLDRGADYAALLHADEAGPEHLLCVLMNDDECAAYRAAVHAFADPATIADEARALAAGIMVSGSAASLPFSVRGVRALRGARALAAGRRDASIGLGHVLVAAFAELPEDLRARFEDAGWSGAAETVLTSPAPGERPVDEGGHLFRHYSDDAKRVLSGAAKLARLANEPSISPALLLLASLQANPALERAGGVSASRARMLLRERTLDETPAEVSELAPDDSLVEFLRSLPAGADSLGLLAHFHAGPTPELARVLARHKVTPALLVRVRTAFRDAE